MAEEVKSAEATPAAPVASTPAPAPATGGSKKNNSAVVIIVVILVILVVLGIGGYFISRYLARKASEKVAEGLLNAATGTTTDISSAKWPSTMPSDVPEYKAGKITMTTSNTDSSGKGWFVTIGETNQSDYTAYKAKLEAAGWTNISSTTVGAVLDQYEKSSYSMSMVFDGSSSGVSITVVPNSE